MRPEEDGLLNIEIGSNKIGAKCCLQTSPDSVWSVTPDVFWYGGTGALEITPHSFVKGHNTDELVGWYGVASACTDLHIIRNGTLTARRYADEILRPHVIPYAGAIGDSFVFQDDNARPHRARLVENMLEAETIQRMEWPACSPDLNPTTHCCATKAACYCPRLADCTS